MKLIYSSFVVLALFAFASLANAQTTQSSAQNQQTSFEEPVDAPTKKIGFRFNRLEDHPFFLSF